MSWLSTITQWLGGEPDPTALSKAPRKPRETSGSRQPQVVVYNPGQGASHPGITKNDLEYSWRHPYYFAALNHIAAAGMGVPLLVQKLVPEETAKAAGRFVTRGTAAHVQRKFASVPYYERRAYCRAKALLPEDVDDAHPLRVLLDQVNPQDTWREMIYTTLFDLRATGNAYWELVGGKNYAPPKQLRRMRPDRVKVVPDATDWVQGYEFSANGATVQYEPDEVLHFRYPHPLNDFYGLSSAETLEQVLKADWSRLMFAVSTFDNNLNLGGLLIPKGDVGINEDELRRLIDVFEKKHKGADNAGKVAVLQDFIWQQTQQSARDAEYLGMAQRHDTEISAVTGVPTQLFRAEDVNRANYEAAQLQFWSDTMQPLLDLVAGNINEFLAPRYGDDIVTQFDLTVVKALQEDIGAQAKREDVAFNSGVTSIDEYRQALGYDALPDGIGARYKRKAVEDYVTLEEIANPPEPEPQPSPPQFAPPAEDTDSGAIEPPGRDEMPADEETPKGAIATREKAVIAAGGAVPFGSSEHAAIVKAFDDRIAPREDALERDVIAWGDDLRDAVLGKLEPFKSLKASVPDAEAVLFDVDEAGNALWKTVRGAALEAAIAEGRQVLGEIALRLPNAGDLFFDRENPRVIAHLRDKELKVKTVARTLHDDLRARIVAGERAGLPISDIADSIQQRFGQLKDYQARRIAQTEIVGASNVGAAAAIELAELGKEWIATLDDRVRDSHARLHGNVVGADETFANGLLHPGDANGPAEEVINCLVDPNAPVFTSDGWKPIGDIVVGDKVLTHLGRFRPVTGLSREPGYKGPIVKLHFELFASLTKEQKAIRVTPNHRVLTDRGWVAAKNVRQGDKLISIGLPCPVCGNPAPLYRSAGFCSKTCSSRASAKAQWDDPAHRANISRKTTNQLHRDYKHGIRDAYAITKKARHAAFDKYGSGGYIGANREQLQPAITAGVQAKYGSHFEMLRQCAFPALGRANNGSALNKRMAQFLARWQTEVIPEFSIGRRRVDFYLPEHKLFIECDGSTFHQDAEADKHRDISILRLYPDHSIARVRYGAGDNGKPDWEYRTLETLNHDGQYEQFSAEVTSVEIVQPHSARIRYNIAVEEDESYIVKGIAVHNCRCSVAAVIPED